jgi:hypothetical protein
MPSARRDGSLAAPLTLRSPRVIGSPRRRCAHPADFAVTACYLLSATTVFSPRRLSSRRVLSALRDGVVLIPPTFWSLRVNHSPLRRWTRTADFLVAGCSPLAAPVVFSPRNFPVTACHPDSATTLCPDRGRCRHSVSSARHAGRLLVVSACDIRSQPSRCALHAHVPVAVYYPLAAPVVWSPRQGSGGRLPL